MPRGEEHLAIVAPEAPPPAQIQAVDDPEAMLAAGAKKAAALRKVVEQAGLALDLGGKRYVRVEGWTSLAALMGAVVREVEVTERDGAYTAVVELVRLSDGLVLSRASAECGHDEEAWAKRPPYARRSMAITRAAGKVCRLAYSWVMALAGYEPTPAEEIVDLQQPTKAQAAPQTQAATSGRHPQPADAKITDGQVRLIRARILAAKLEMEPAVNRIKERFQVQHLGDLTRAQLEEVLGLIEEWGKGGDRLL